MVTSAGTQADERDIFVDCANGVGSLPLAKIKGGLANLGVHLHMFNTGSGILNKGCGSDYVQRNLRLPDGFPETLPTACRCCAIDGDADRIIFFTMTGETLTLLDGDRVAVLMASFIQDTLLEIGDLAADISLGAGQASPLHLIASAGHCIRPGTAFVSVY